MGSLRFVPALCAVAFLCSFLGENPAFASKRRSKSEGKSEAKLPEEQTPNTTRLGLEEKLSFNTEKQLNSSLTGLYSFSKEIFGVASVQYGQYPSSAPKDTIRNMGGVVQGGYNTGLWGLDGAVFYNYSSISALKNQGFGVGATFAYIPGMLDGGPGELDLLKAANRQTYQTEMRRGEEPLFWARAGITSGTYTSRFLDGEETSPTSSLRQTALTLDAHYPVNPVSVLSAGVSLYSYSDNPGYVATRLSATASDRVFLIAGTFQNLPSFSTYTEYSWQITPRDSFIPRTQATLIAASSQWEIGGSLTWRRRMTKHLYFTPSYDIAVLGSAVWSGATLSLFHDF